MPHPLPRSARVALGAVKATLVGSIAVAGWANAAASTGAAPPVVEQRSGYAGFPVDDRPGHLQRLLDAHQCSVTGFTDGRTPRSAVVRSAAGHLRHVTFERGWRIYTAHGAATLVAVCLDEPAAGHAARHATGHVAG